ncbi:MAG: tyrosine protein phosphatase yvh1 [Thelocarpon superellum]|nr:MAG: tyrosine protein phosphatase yvh1 [Thelocarpon superellum]
MALDRVPGDEKIYIGGYVGYDHPLPHCPHAPDPHPVAASSFALVLPLALAPSRQMPVVAGNYQYGRDPDLAGTLSMFALRRKEALREANITHVLSVLRLPLDKTLFSGYEHRVVEVDDVDDENLLAHFPQTNDFIQRGLDGGGGVLVHW